MGIQTKFSLTKIDKSGQLLKSPKQAIPYAIDDAEDALDSWRSAHAYPIKVFQANARMKIKRNTLNGFVVQRLKRHQSILNKLKRFKSMRLTQMDDIGGVRAVVENLKQARILEDLFVKSRAEHHLVGIDDYINKPKPISGYRGIHLIYKFDASKKSTYNNLLLEIQIRTNLQHYWATTVEIVDTLKEFDLKSSIGPNEWLDFFTLVSSAFAHLENAPLVPMYSLYTRLQTFQKVMEEERRLNVVKILKGFRWISDVAEKTDDRQKYYLIVVQPKLGRTDLYEYEMSRFSEAASQYRIFEEKIRRGQKLQVVLVSTNSVLTLKRAYPNYFFDTDGFILAMEGLENELAQSR